MQALSSGVPFDLSKISYQIFSEYVVSCRKGNGEFMSYSHYNSKRSALTHLFFESGSQIDDALWMKISTLYAGLRRKIVRQNQQLGKRATTGRERLPFPAYKFLCRKLREAGDKHSIFAHAMLTLSWSLISRAEQATTSHIHHIDWHEDCLVIYFHHRKTDQNGINKSEPWHVYANPLDPDICPVLSMGVYLLSLDTILSKGGQLFQGPNPYKRYAEALQRLGEKYKDELAALGMDVKYLGPYSVRKGAGTQITAGCTVVPPIISVCLRAGWSIGNVKERYLHYECAGDQFTGRTVTGLDVMDKTFAVSPPYFEGDDSVISAVDKWVLAVGGESVKDHPHLRIAIRFLLASACFHHDYLVSVLPSDSPFFSSIAFATMPEETVRKSAVIRYPWNKTDQTPKLTGIPPHVAILCKMEGVEQRMGKLEGLLAGVPEQISDLPGKIVENIGEGRNIVVNNLGGGSGDPQLVEKVKRMTEYFQQMTEGGGGASGSSSSGGGQGEAISGGDGLPPLFRWADGSNHRLPENFKFTKGQIFKSFIREWIIGSTGRPGGDIPPLRVLKAKDVKHVCKSAKQRMSDMRAVMKKVEEIGRREGAWKGNASRHWQVEDCSKLYDVVMKDLYPDDDNDSNGQRKNKKRKLEISWSAVHKDHIKKKSKKND